VIFLTSYLAAKQSDKAVVEFKKLIANQGLEDPTLPRSILAHLCLARAYNQEHNLPDSRHEYEMFLALWNHADPDLPLLKEAKQEYASLK
jgi:Tfp pilus assembly protein PilF